MNHSQTFGVTGMTCGNCVEKVRRRLAEYPGMVSASVTLQPPQAVLLTDAPLSAADLDAWLAAVGNYHVTALLESDMPKEMALPAASATTYRPLIILLLYLLAVSGGVLYAAGGWNTMLAMRLFMGGFFIAFSFFKMLDLRGFADAYRSYDLVAKVWPAYGFVYPFVELGLGLAYLANVNPTLVNAITVVVMAISLMGVLRAVLSKTRIRCACLGTVFKLPMSTVTIVEDGLMLAMSVFMLIHLLQ